MRIYIDIETIPTQREDIIRRIEDEAVHAAAAGELPANIANLKSEDLREERAAAWWAKWHAEQERAAAETHHKTALSGDYGEIVCACWAMNDDPVLSYQRDVLPEFDERALLGQLFDHIKIACKGKLPTFIGHNVEFDLRFLHHRLAVHNLRPGVMLPYNTAPWQGRYVDTMYLWCGAKGRIKLTELCHILGIEAEDEIDGSQVWEAYQAGRIDQIVQHCRADVERVRAIDNRLRYL